jgi:drug/metabolite transporter (DMT)-like permease
MQREAVSLVLVLVSAALHAGWNLSVRGQRQDDQLLRIAAVTTLFGLGPVLLAEMGRTPLLPSTWRYFPVAGVFLAIYYLGLTRGYTGGDFTVVYPLARAIPVLLLAVVDVFRGHPPTALGWLGMVLVTAGCVLAPLESPRDLGLAHYRNRTTLWILVAAVGVFGYTTVDSTAARVMPPGVGTAVRYFVLQTAASLVAYLGILAILRQPIRLGGSWAAWQRPTLATGFVLASYSLILWAFQLSPHASYIVALRQFSIVIGVIAAAILFREPAPRFRIAMALIITAGVICIGWGT